MWGLLWGLGCAALTAYHLRRWQQDRVRALRLRAARSAPLPPLEATARVSILVAAWNEAGLLRRHIESVRALSYPLVEYVLCAGGPDGTYQLAKAFERPGFVVLEQYPGEGKQAALRRCLTHATGAVIFLTDADCLLDDDSFRGTLRPVLCGETEVATGASRPLPEQLQRSALAVYRWAADLYAADSTGSATTGILGRNVALTRKALEQAGGFDAEVPSGTDYYLGKALLRTGAHILNVPHSLVASHYHETPGGYIRQQRRWLRNVVVLGLRFGRRDEALQSIRTSLVGLGMLLFPIAALYWGAVAFGVWLLLLAQSVLNKIRYMHFAALADGAIRPAALKQAYWAAAPITFLEFVAWVSPFLDYLRLGRGARW